MRPFVFALLASTILALPRSLAPDSFLFVSGGQSITNGERVNVKALKAKYSGSYFWFSIGGSHTSSAIRKC